MSSPSLQILLGNRQVGSLEFAESDAALCERGARRTADGFVLTLPVRLSLDWQKTLQPMVSNFRAHIFVDDNSSTELGVAYDPNWYTALDPRRENHPIALEWRGSLEALQLLERRRNGGPPKLWLEFFGEVCSSSDPRGTPPFFRGMPERIFGSVHVTYPQNTWAMFMDNLGAVGSVLVEVPVRKDFPIAWKEIYSAIDEAKRHLARGGEDGWKSCVVAVRLALEKWQALEQADLGPGWQQPNRQDKEARTKEQRADGLRWHLLQFAHLSPHSPAEQWERNDAILALAALTALVAERDP